MSILGQDNVALNHELKGIALAQLGNQYEAISELETAVSLADPIKYQPIRWAGRHQLAKLYRQQGREQEAQGVLSEGVRIAQTIAAGLTDESLRVTFLHSQKPQRH
jgi:tetratricopeptide (TPR) repeat protein